MLWEYLEHLIIHGSSKKTPVKNTKINRELNCLKYCTEIVIQAITSLQGGFCLRAKLRTVKLRRYHSYQMLDYIILADLGVVGFGF